MAFPSDWTVRKDGSHYNAAPVWFGEGGRCIQEPRLRYIDRSYHATRSTTRSWIVDGIECASAEEAWDRLQASPAFTEAELAVLATLTDEPTDIRAEVTYEVRRALLDKGVASADRGRYVITDAGRLALSTSSTGAKT